MAQKKLSLENIGEVHFIHSARARNLRIVLKPFNAIQVTVPTGISFDKAEHMLYQKLEWIKKNRAKIAQLERNYTVFTEKTSFQTRDHVLYIQPHAKTTIHLRVSRNKIRVLYPENVSVTHHEIQSLIRMGIEKALRKEAKKYLPSRIAYWAEKYGFTYNKIFFKNLKSRWGSCSAVNNLNFNIQLMRLPDRLIDYLILHELCHTVEKNHGEKFWTLLDKVIGNAKKIDKELKQYRTQIF